MSRRLTLRCMLVLVSFLIMTTTYWGEKIPLKGGAGWDGEQYRELVLHVDEMFFQGEIDAYHMHRVLPFVVSHVALRLTGLPTTAANAMAVTIVVNQLVLLLAMLVFFRLSSLRQWRLPTELMAFAAAFWNVAVLKVFGYYPFLTDELALLLSLLAVCHYFSAKRLWLLADGLLAMLTWPALSVLVFLLLVFPAPLEAHRARSGGLPAGQWLRWVGVVFYPLLFLAFIYYKVRVHGDISFAEMFTLRPARSALWAAVATAVVPMFYWWALRPLSAVRLSLGQMPWRRVVLGTAVFVILYKLTEWGSGVSGFTMAQELGQIAQLPASDVLVFLETPFIYWGPFFLLLLCLWPMWLRRVAGQESMGYLLTAVFFIFFLVDIETRKHVMFFPFLLVPLMDEVDRLQLRRWVSGVFVALSLLMAAWWYPWNQAGMAEALNTYELRCYLQFPAQWYFMFQGPWQGHLAYAISLAAEAGLLVGIYLLNRGGLLTKK